MTVHNISNRSANDRVNSMSRRDAKAVFHPYTNAIANEFEGPLCNYAGRRCLYFGTKTGRNISRECRVFACASLGFGEKRLATAAARQMNELPFYHGFNQKGHPSQIESWQNVCRT